MQIKNLHTKIKKIYQKKKEMESNKIEKLNIGTLKFSKKKKRKSTNLLLLYLNFILPFQYFFIFFHSRITGRLWNPKQCNWISFCCTTTHSTQFWDEKTINLFVKGRLYSILPHCILCVECYSIFDTTATRMSNQPTNQPTKILTTYNRKKNCIDLNTNDGSSIVVIVIVLVFGNKKKISVVLSMELLLMIMMLPMCVCIYSILLIQIKCLGLKFQKSIHKQIDR